MSKNPVPHVETRLPALGLGEEAAKWRDQFSRSHQHPGFSPSPRQLFLMQVVASALDDGITYTMALLDHATVAVGSKKGVLPYVGFERDVFYARQAVLVKRSFVQVTLLAKSMRLRAQDKLGTLVVSDGKRLTSVRVIDVDPRGWVYTMSGQRGPVAMHISIDAYAVKAAIERAYESGKRTNSFDEFVSTRAHLPQTQVVADPLEPYYKTDEKKSADMQASRLLWTQSQTQVELARKCMQAPIGVLGLSVSNNIARMFEATAEMFNAQADVLSHNCDAGPEYEKLLAIAQQKRLLQESARHLVDHSCPQWEAKLAEVDEAAQAEKLAQENQRQEGARLRAQLAAADSPRVRELAQRIVDSIARQVISNTEKSNREKLAKNYITEQQASEHLASARQSWDRIASDDRTLSLARAIDRSDPSPLIHAWAKDGQGVSGNEGSMKAFADITGINLLKLNSSDRAMAIYRWANWSDEQIAEQRALQEAAQASKDAAREQTHKADHRLFVLRKAQTAMVNTPQGAISTMAYVDGLVAKGFKDIFCKKVGAVTKTYLANLTTGTGHLMQGSTMIDYAKVASEIANAEPVPERESEGSTQIDACTQTM